MIKSVSVFVLLSCSLLSDVALAATQNKGKVVVSQFSEFIDITEHVPEFSTWSELQAYLDENNKTKPSETLKAINTFANSSPQLTPEQLSNFNLYWAQNEETLGNHTNARTKLSQVSQLLLAEAKQLEYLLLKGHILIREHELFDATAVLKTAYNKAQQQQKIKVSNNVSLQLASLYFELNAQRQAEMWLGKVAFEVSEKTDLATLLETSVKLAQLQTRLNQYAKAEQTLLSTIDYLGDKNLESLQTSLRFQLAEVYLHWPKFELARKAFEQSFLSAQKSRDVSQQVRALVGLMELDLSEEMPWQANKTLTQANKLESSLFDQEVRLMFWQTKARVLAAKGHYTQALALLSKYEQAINLEQKERLWLESLNNKLLWQLKSGQVGSAQDSFKHYQHLSVKIAKQDSNSKLSFLQQSREFDRRQAQIEQQKQTAQIQTLQSENQTNSNRISTLYNVVLLIFVAAGIGMYWLYRKFTYEKVVDSLRDPVSQAYNHRFLSRQFDSFKAKNHTLSLVMFDLDGMARVNANLGHEQADLLLQQATCRLKNRLFKNAWLTRISGDRFVVLANKFDQKQALVLAEILRKELNSNDFKINKHKVKLRASFAALECLPEEDLESIKRRLYQVVSNIKLDGGNQTRA